MYSMNRNLAVPGARPTPVQLRILKSAQDPLQASCPDIRAGPVSFLAYINFPNQICFLCRLTQSKIRSKTSSFSPCDLPWGGRSAAQGCCSHCSGQLIGPAAGRRRWQQASGIGCWAGRRLRRADPGDFTGAMLDGATSLCRFFKIMPTKLKTETFWDSLRRKVFSFSYILA